MCVLCGPGPAQAVVDHSITHPFVLEPESDYMCSECGEHVSVHPDKMEFLAKHRMDTIIKSGHQVMNIMGGNNGPDFSYSVGRSVKDRPELLITGNLPPEVRGAIINTAADYDDEHGLKPGLIEDGILDGVPVKIVRVRSAAEAEMHYAREFGDDIEALQIVWPDSQGNWPPTWEYGPDAQPLYGDLP